MRFENTDELKGAEFVNVDLTGARFKEARLVDVRMSGLIDGLFVNDIEVAPLIRAEMERRHPERRRLVPTDAEGVREGWSIIEDLWRTTMSKARALPEAALHERVDDEWSFLETVRHLIMVTDAWISGNALGQTGQFHPMGVAPSFITDPAAMGLDVDADPSLAEVTVVRDERMDVVRQLVGGLTDADLERKVSDHTMLRCLWTLFDEEWAHNWYANRDLDVLTGRP